MTDLTALARNDGKSYFSSRAMALIQEESRP